MRALLPILFVVACGGDDPAKKPDAAVDAYFSKCGQPGDMGNEIGVGKFCPNGLSDCSDTVNAPLCSAVGDRDTHFCTTTCQMGSTGTCGTGAVCECNSSNQCGCTPMACL